MDQQKANEKKPEKRKKSTSKKTRVIGNQQYVNASTGEVEHFQVISIEERDANFQKIWLGHVLAAVDELSNAKMKLLFFLLEESSKLENIIVMTIREIAAKTGFSLQTVVSTLGALEKHDIIRRKTGVIMLNPGVIFRGTYGKRMNVLFKYGQFEDLKDDIQNKDKQENEEKQKQLEPKTEKLF
jgi:DNA-binding Lrp family transcriptional regulator